MSDPHTVPEGFKPLDSASPFNQLVGPYYAQRRGDAIVVGLRLEDKHCNTRGRLHGGMVSAIFDIALGHNVGLEIVRAQGEDDSKFDTGVPGGALVTVSLNTEYLGTAQRGDWIEAHATVQRTGRSLVFGNTELWNGAQRIAKGNGIFRIFLQ
ncbi:MAG: PaaI family thioesterase [Pseudomonadota bacterium]